MSVTILQLVRARSLFLNQKAYFPARFMSVKRTMQDRLILRVSVLDLDNYCRFDEAYIRASEEKRRIRMLSASKLASP